MSSPCFRRDSAASRLEEIVGLIREGGQEIQLHLHPEWVNESVEPLLENIDGKRQHLRYYSRAEQEILVTAGKRLIAQAGGGECSAFRAGSFGFNRDTLAALAANGIRFDSSYNATIFGLDSGVGPGQVMVDAFECDGIHEYPMTVYDDGTASLRHAQLTACSHREMEGLLWQALESGRRSFMILSHNFELLNTTQDRPDDVVVSRFRQLCAFLDRNRDSFKVRGFEDLSPNPVIAAAGAPEIPSLENCHENAGTSRSQEVSMMVCACRNYALKYQLSDWTIFSASFRCRCRR